MKTLTFEIDEVGKPKIAAAGFPGKTCHPVTEAYAKALSSEPAQVTETAEAQQAQAASTATTTRRTLRH